MLANEHDVVQRQEVEQDGGVLAGVEDERSGLGHGPARHPYADPLIGAISERTSKLLQSRACNSGDGCSTSSAGSPCAVR